MHFLLSFHIQYELLDFENEVFKWYTSCKERSKSSNGKSTQKKASCMHNNQAHPPLM